MTPGRCRSNLKSEVFSLIRKIDTLSISCEIALRVMLQDLIDDKSILVQVMAWCRQAISHYLSQCWLKSLWPYGITKLYWVNWVNLCQISWAVNPYKSEYGQGNTNTFVSISYNFWAPHPIKNMVPSILDNQNYGCYKPFIFQIPIIEKMFFILKQGTGSISSMHSEYRSSIHSVQLATKLILILRGIKLIMDIYWLLMETLKQMWNFKMRVDLWKKFCT